jgi:DnaJ-class molecular chaperone
MADPYQLLGVSREAKPEDIRKAYRQLAKKNHPDLHPGDKSAEARFKDIATAYAILGDEAKRVLFDTGKIDAAGTEIQPLPERPSYRQHAESQPSFKYGQHWDVGDGDGDLFAGLFGHRGNANARGSDVNYAMSVDFIEAVTGAKKRVTMADGRVLDLAIPPGLGDGQTLRLRGQGEPGRGSGSAGDVLVAIRVEPHRIFRREANDILSTVPVTLGEAMAGARVPVETVTGSVTLSIPRGSDSGTKLRLRGKGVPAKRGPGDHIVEIRVVLPKHPDDDLIRYVVEWEGNHPYDPRKELAI